MVGASGGGVGGGGRCQAAAAVAKGPARKVADVEESPLAALGMGNEKVYEDIAAVANACDLDQSCDPRRRSQYIFAGNIICRTIDFGILA